MQLGGRWTAPHIFDGNGELIWSGAVCFRPYAQAGCFGLTYIGQYLSKQYDVFDFRISNVLGEEMLTFLYPQNRSAVILDRSYNIRASVPIAGGRRTVDMHEFHFVDNGTRALFFFNEARNVSKEAARAIGYHEGDCLIGDCTFRELDVTNEFEETYIWSAAEHIGLYESSEVQQPLHERCKQVRVSA